MLVFVFLNWWMCKTNTGFTVVFTLQTKWTMPEISILALTQCVCVCVLQLALQFRINHNRKCCLRIPACPLIQCLTFDEKHTTVWWRCARHTVACAHRTHSLTYLGRRCAACSVVLGILSRTLVFKTAGRGAPGPHFIMPFKGPIRLQLLNGKACKSYIIHVEHSEKAQELSSSAL